jgi:glutamine amidotransferase
MIAIIEGCGTNVASVQYALLRLGKESVLTSNPMVIKNASHVIIPGVSTAKRALMQLSQRNLIDVIYNLKQPVLGICSGMQILFKWCAEGNVEGLNIFSERVDKLCQLTLHMGWNTLEFNPAIISKHYKLLQGINNQSYVYFVHSYAAGVNNDTLARAQFGKPFSAIVAKNNFYGTQFHPERSGIVGAKILDNFLKLSEDCNEVDPKY